MSNPNYSMRVIVRTKGGRTTSVWIPIAALNRTSIIDALTDGYYEAEGGPDISPVLAGTVRVALTLVGTV
jgi:hypothetical protein